jgi:hypothetical protein
LRCTGNASAHAAKSPRQAAKTSALLRGTGNPETCWRPRPNRNARTEFEKNIKIDKRDFGAIEFLLRKGRRQLDMYASPGVKDIR